MDEIALPSIRATASGATRSDAERFERLWRASYSAVHAHAARRVGADADEVCAEVFLVAWRRFDELPTDALPWLLAVSRNVIGTSWRGDTRRERLHERLHADASIAVEGVRPRLDDELFSALARLGDDDRELVLLVYWEDLGISRAARTLGITPTTARTRLWRAKRRLRAELTCEEPTR